MTTATNFPHTISAWRRLKTSVRRAVVVRAVGVAVKACPRGDQRTLLALFQANTASGLDAKEGEP